MPPVVQPPPENGLAEPFRITFGRWLAIALPAWAGLAALAVSYRWLDVPLPPGTLSPAELRPVALVIGLACFVVAWVPANAVLLRILAYATLDNALAAAAPGRPPAQSRREMVEGVRRELRERNGPVLRAALGLSPEAWAAASGELLLAVEPLTVLPGAAGRESASREGELPLLLRSRRGRPRVEVVWVMRRDADDRWRLGEAVPVTDWLRSHLNPLRLKH